MPKVTFINKENTFFSSVKHSVDQYFLTRNLRKTGTAKLYIKTIVLIPSAISLYYLLVFRNDFLLVGIGSCILLGIVLASIGFNVMHDACHGSYSRFKSMNEFMGYSLNALGGNAFIWKFKHNILHHTYPNMDGIDDDIAKSPMMRHCSTQKWYPIHRAQHIYVFFIYALTSIAWVFFFDFMKYFKRKIGHMDLQKMNMKEHLIFWVSKILYVYFYVALPVYMLGWQKWAVGYLIVNVVMGFSLAIVFQLAHAVEHTAFEWVGPQDSLKIENEWAIYQVKATANFATNNGAITWLVGGLNFQIEHHLFPRISHVHYPALNQIVRQECLRFKIPYNEFHTMTEAIRSHVNLMKAAGKGPADS